MQDSSNAVFSKLDLDNVAEQKAQWETDVSEILDLVYNRTLELDHFIPHSETSEEYFFCPISWFQQESKEEYQASGKWFPKGEGRASQILSAVSLVRDIWTPG